MCVYVYTLECTNTTLHSTEEDALNRCSDNVTIADMDYVRSDQVHRYIICSHTYVITYTYTEC